MFNLNKMLDFIDHSPNTFVIGKSPNLIQLGKAQSLYSSFLRRGLGDNTLDEFNADHGSLLLSLDAQGLAPHLSYEFSAS